MVGSHGPKWAKEEDVSGTRAAAERERAQGTRRALFDARVRQTAAASLKRTRAGRPSSQQSVLPVRCFVFSFVCFCCLFVLFYLLSFGFTFLVLLHYFCSSISSFIFLFLFSFLH